MTEAESVRNKKEPTNPEKMNNHQMEDIQSPENMKNLEEMQSPEEFIIEMRDVTKIYHLYGHPMDRLKEGLSITHKSYHRDHMVLKDFNLAIRHGESVGFVGKNGAGKSTLLKLITGVLSANSGTIQVRGKVAALLELGAGFNMEYTGRQNIFLNGKMMGYSKV